MSLGDRDCAIVIFALEPAPHAVQDDRIGQCAQLYAKAIGTSHGSFAIERGMRGKPYFPASPEIHFSVSHSGNCWLCAFARAPLGIDVQQHRDVDDSLIACRFFHAAERRMLADKGQANFFSIWTAKESYVKYTGQGITDEFRRFSVVANGAIASGVGDARFAHIALAPGYTACVCAHSIGEIRFISTETMKSTRA